MAYRKQVEIVQPGSLNLALPTDGVGSDSIAMHNFRTDRHGCLRSRQSMTSSVAPSGLIHTIYRHGQNRIYGADDELYNGTTQIVPTSGAYTFNTSDLKPFGLASFAGFLWIMTPDLQQCWNGGGTSNTWAVAAVSTAPSQSLQAGGSLVDGQTYEYYVTYETALGEETNPTNPVTASPSGSNLTVRITPTAHTDARVTLWNVYRVGNTLPEAYRVAQLPVATTSFDDTGAGDYSDLEVTRRGIVLETDHDAPPSAAGLEGPYYQRLVAYCTSAHKNRVFYTKPNKPWHFPSTYWFDVGDESDEIIRIVQHPSHLRIYKKRSIWRLYGDCDSGRLERTNASLGLIGAAAIATRGGLDYFQGQEGIYVNNGDVNRSMSDKLETIWRDGITFASGAYPNIAIQSSEAVRQKHSLAIKNNRLYYSYIDESGAAAYQTLVCDLDTGNWCSQTTDAAGLGGYTALFDEGQYGELLGAANGAIWALEQISTANAIPLTWTSAYRDQGFRDRKKTYSDLVIEHSTKRSAADQNCTVKLKLDSGDTSDLAVGSIPVATVAAGAARTVSTFPLGTDKQGVEARNAAIHIESTSGINYETVIYSAALHYYLEPRDATTWDSGIIDLNDPRVKGLELLWLDIASTIALTYTIWTELPGGAMAIRQTGDFTPGTRRPFTIETPGVEGRLLRIVIQRKTSVTSGTFRLYGARLRYKAIGIYLEGARSNVWQTPELAPGV
jgi:hypothetical protein